MNFRWILPIFAFAICVAMMAHTAIAQDATGNDDSNQAATETTNTAFETASIVLYNSTSEFGNRAPPAEVIAAFIKQIQAKASELWIDKQPQEGKSGLIAVAIRPDGTMKFWVDIDREHHREISEELDSKMQKVGVPQVRDGPVAFAINFHLWGGPDAPKDGAQSFELPQAWKLAAKKDNTEGRLKVPDDLLALVWKPQHAEPADVGSKSYSPDGFVLQELRPLGGNILRPKDWIYTEQHRKNTLMWTISKEDPKEAGYETGVRIQFFAGVKALTGQSPKEFIEAFLDGKKKASKVISDCPETRQGIFNRVCLQTEELIPDAKNSTKTGTATYRILYSCFWSDETDMAAVSIAGTTSALWDTHVKTFDTMAQFQLLSTDEIKKQSDSTID